MQEKSKIGAWFAQLNDSKERFGSKEFFIAYGKIIIGCIIFALADLFFVVPYGLAPGGVYGLMSVFHNLWGSPMALVIYMDVALLIIGSIFLGPRFGIKTILSIFLIWFVTWITEYLFIRHTGYRPLIFTGDMISAADYANLSDQLKELYLPVAQFKDLAPVTEYFRPWNILNVLVGGLAYGIGIAIIFSAGATSGGSDIIAMIVNKYSGISLGMLVIIIDSTIALSSLALGQGIDLPIYSIILVYIEGKVIDLIVPPTKKDDKKEEIKQAA
ncbi:MAG: YitT family protein [Bacteroidales bacterium]|nr:YitT family protein [Bacteroidales bacterium]